MIELNEIREQIDEVDKKIVELFEKRMELGKAVAQYKQQVGKPILDKQRERQKIEAMQDLATNPSHKRAVSELFLQLMSLSRKYQYTLIGERQTDMLSSFHMVEQLPIYNQTKIVCQKEACNDNERHKENGQYIVQFFGEDTKKLYVEQLKEVFQILEEEKAEYGVVPIQINDTIIRTLIYDLLLLHEDICIVAEENIHDKRREENKEMSFLILKKGRMYQKDAKKIMVSVQLSNEVGSLYEMLSNLLHNNINLTRIESGELKENGQISYHFLMEFIGNLQEPSVRNACTVMREESLDFRVLGNY